MSMYTTLYAVFCMPELGARFIVGALLELLDYWLQHPEAGTPEVMARHMFRLVFRRDPD